MICGWNWGCKRERDFNLFGCQTSQAQRFCVWLAFLLPAMNMPTDIQWMPPGLHTVPREGGRVLEFRATEAAANRLIESLKEIVRAGERPWFDSQHKFKTVIARPVFFYWAGEGERGGIRAQIEWTDFGARWVSEGHDRSFSAHIRVIDKEIYPPEFPPLSDKEAYRRAGIPWWFGNLGAFTNAPALACIKSIWAGTDSDFPVEPHPFFRPARVLE